MQVLPKSGPQDDMDESPKIVMVDKNIKLAAFDTETDEQRAAKVSVCAYILPVDISSTVHCLVLSRTTLQCCESCECVAVSYSRLSVWLCRIVG